MADKDAANVHNKPVQIITQMARLLWITSPVLSSHSRFFAYITFDSSPTNTTLRNPFARSRMIWSKAHPMLSSTAFLS